MESIREAITRIKSIPVVRVMMQKNVQLQGMGMFAIALLLIAPATTNCHSHQLLSNIALLVAFLLSLLVGYWTADREKK